MPKKIKPDRPSALTRVAGKFTRPAVYEFPSRTRVLAAPLQITEDGVLAWFVLDPLNWEFMPLDERISVWDAQRSRLGQLAEAVDLPDGRPVHIRRTTRPYAAFEAAARLDAQADPLDPVEGAETWNTGLAHMQRRLRSTGLDQKLTMVGIWVGPSPSDEAVEDLAGPTVEHPRREAVEILNRFKETAAMVADGGLNGVPATADDLAFVLHRSLSMGVPAPSMLRAEDAFAVWHADGLGEFMDRSAWVVSPLGRSVEVLSEAEGVPTSRHVAVLSLGVMPEKVWPESGEHGWMMAFDCVVDSEGAGFPVEISFKGVLKKGSVVEKDAVYNLRRANAIASDYADHAMKPPESVGRAIRSAEASHDEITEGTTVTSPRLDGTGRLAVYGATAEEMDDRARRVMIFAKDKVRIPAVRNVDQGRALREFVPGEPEVPGGFKRRLSMGYLAAAMPNIDAQVGTRHGFYIGYTSLSKRAVLFDPHWAAENDLPGLFPIVGQPGSGKSFFTGQLAYSLAMSGRRTIVQDLSGPLAALTRLPELAPYSAELNLVRADEGTLSPPLMIPTPVRDDFRDSAGVVDELEFQRAVKSARADRIELATDSLRMLLSPGLSRTLGVDQRLSDAVRSMEGESAAAKVPATMWNLRWALDYLARRADELGQQIRQELEAAAEFPGGQLIIPSHRDPVEDARLADKMLIVVTAPGIAPPPSDTAREDWSISERYSQPLLHLSSFLTAKAVYSRPRHERKAVLGDEAHGIVQHASGRNLLARLSSDSRKFNLFTTFASQSPKDIQALGPRWSSLIGGAFVFRLRKAEAALQACEMIDIAPEYADAIRVQRSGECVFMDPLGRKAKMQVDAGWHPSHAVLNTTPKQERREWSPDLPPAPELDPALFRKKAVS